MQKRMVITLMVVAGLGLIVVLIFDRSGKDTTTETIPVGPTPAAKVPVNAKPVPAASSVSLPLAGFSDRVTKKPFGIYVTPKNSPVQPEKFTGYHTGADAETTADEATTDIPIYAAVDGTVVVAEHVNGYGGVIMIRSTLDGVPLTTLYGHLRIASFTTKVGTSVKHGDKIAVLGTGNSTETDGERKHLHFAVLKGNSEDLRGYVQQKEGLDAWDDPVAWLKEHNAR